LGGSCNGKWWYILLLLGIYYINLVYFVAIGGFCGSLVFSPSFGILCQEKSGNPGSNPHSTNITMYIEWTRCSWIAFLSFCVALTRIARWYIFIPKIPIWV
jgi:hypothetical protein